MEDRDHFLFRIPETWREAYRPWLTPTYNGWVDAALFDNLTQRQQSDPEALFRRDDVEVVRRDRNLTVRIPIDQRVIWLKRFRPSNPVDRFVYAVRPGKAVYAWNAAMALLDNGFATPRPVIGLRAAGRAGGAAGIVAFEDMTGYQPVRQLLNDNGMPASRRRRLMLDLGACLKRFHDLGFRHRDLRQGNILAAPGADCWSFSLLDLNRLRVQSPLTTIQRIREVEKLNLSVEDMTSFFESYMPDSDARRMAVFCAGRISFTDRLERLPLGKLFRKAWYYWWEVRAFSRARRP